MSIDGCGHVQSREIFFFFLRAFHSFLNETNNYFIFSFCGIFDVNNNNRCGVWVNRPTSLAEPFTRIRPSLAIKTLCEDPFFL